MGDEKMKGNRRRRRGGERKEGGKNHSPSHGWKPDGRVPERV